MGAEIDFLFVYTKKLLKNKLQNTRQFNFRNFISKFPGLYFKKHRGRFINKRDNFLQFYHGQGQLKKFVRYSRPFIPIKTGFFREIFEKKKINKRNSGRKLHVYTFLFLQNSRIEVNGKKNSIFYFRKQTDKKVLMFFFTIFKIMRQNIL